MKQTTKQTEMQNVTQKNNNVQRIAYVIFSIIEILLAMRLVFKLLGANSENAFVKGIYNITHPLVMLFEGVFSRTTVSGSENISVFEPATLIAMVVIGIVAWILMMLIPESRNSSKKTEYTENDEENNNG